MILSDHTLFSEATEQNLAADCVFIRIKKIEIEPQNDLKVKFCLKPVEKRKTQVISLLNVYFGISKQNLNKNLVSGTEF